MTPESVAHLIDQMFVAAFWISAPLLAIGFVAGILISVIQIVTSIQDTGFNSIPRLMAFLGGCLALMPWMVHTLPAMRLLPVGVFDTLADFFGITTAMDEFTGREGAASGR